MFNSLRDDDGEISFREKVSLSSLSLDEPTLGGLGLWWRQARHPMIMQPAKVASRSMRAASPDMIVGIELLSGDVLYEGETSVMG